VDHQEDSKSINSECDQSVHGIDNDAAAGASHTASSMAGGPRHRIIASQAPLEMAALDDGHRAVSYPQKLNMDRSFTSYPTEQTMVNKPVDAHPNRRDRPATVGQNRQPLSMSRTRTMRSDQTKRTGYGGFPMPFQLVKSLIQRFSPETNKKLQRTLTQYPDESGKPSTAFSTSFPLKIGRNSLFVDLTKEQKEELGGIEYRASKLLLKVVYSVSHSVIRNAEADRSCSTLSSYQYCRWSSWLRSCRSMTPMPNSLRASIDE
jgi:hypothetical protein